MQIQIVIHKDTSIIHHQESQNINTNRQIQIVTVNERSHIRG